MANTCSQRAVLQDGGINPADNFVENCTFISRSKFSEAATSQSRWDVISNAVQCVVREGSLEKNPTIHNAVEKEKIRKCFLYRKKIYFCSEIIFKKSWKI